MAQDKKDAGAQSSTSLLVNGQLIHGKVLEIDGKHFVAVEDLAQSLRGTIAYGDARIALTLFQPSSAASHLPSTAPSPAPAPPSVPAPPAASTIPPTPARQLEAGRIKGTLTYFLDFHAGNVPDTGSKVWLVAGAAGIPVNKTFVGTSTAVGTSENPEQYKAIQYAITDKNGNFEFPGVPPGKYTLILQSAHTKGTLKTKGHFLGEGNRNNPRDSSGRVEFLPLLIKAGETADGSKDFGPTIDWR
ncbi:MAG TPA: hypothetical protein VNI36_12325 [Candidatus Dormibacteraeota bacterium]|nr:hypothetical protein [Candidatus Dormibacteraeota bacterium]